MRREIYLEFCYTKNDLFRVKAEMVFTNNELILQLYFMQNRQDAYSIRFRIKKFDGLFSYRMAIERRKQLTNGSTNRN